MACAGGLRAFALKRAGGLPREGGGASREGRQDLIWSRRDRLPCLSAQIRQPSRRPLPSTASPRSRANTASAALGLSDPGPVLALFPFRHPKHLAQLAADPGEQWRTR